MKIRNLLLTLAVLLGGAFAAAAENVEWMTDFDAAQKLAQKEQRPMLVFFTGSDWCGYCMQLEAHVLTQAGFAKFVRKTGVIPVKLDFPTRKLQGAEVRQKNKALQKKYQVRAFPTMMVMDCNGKVQGKIEGFAGLAEDYIAELRAYLPKK